MLSVDELALVVGVVMACAALGISRASWYRRQRPERERARPPRKSPARALSPAEREQVLDTLNSERFMDQPPTEVYARLLDEDEIYLCSPRTMYRILDSAKEVRERRNQLRHPNYTPPQLLATAPNQVWTWDITKLVGPVKWTYYHLYVLLDLFSRYVVGWMLAHRESGALASRLIEETCQHQGIESSQLSLHSDRGPSMTSHSVAMLSARLGVQLSHNRPYVSNDNPFSEAQFKTLKYRPEFPRRFGSYEHALSVSRELFRWYNNEHHHGSLGLMTPASVHYGHAPRLLNNRRNVLFEAFRRNPERFVHGAPEPPSLPEAVWINPPAEKTTRQDALGAIVSTPDDLQHPPPLSSYEPSVDPAVLADLEVRH
jgi:putative transposase